MSGKEIRRKVRYGGGPTATDGTYEYVGDDILATIQEEEIGVEGMKIDRMFYEQFEDRVRANDFIAASVEALGLRQPAAAFVPAACCGTTCFPIKFVTNQTTSQNGQQAGF